jgi:hypothetical protein
MQGGSYEFRADGTGSRVVLATLYSGHLRPRWLWRPLERFLAHRLHRHILDGMRDALQESVLLGPVPELLHAHDTDHAQAH